MTPVQKLGEAIADRIERWMPNPFLFAILLTYLAAMAAFISEGSGPLKSPNHGMAVWNLLQFSINGLDFGYCECCRLSSKGSSWHSFW